jgi:hypothetical protein
LTKVLKFYFPAPISCLGILQAAARLSAKDMPRHKGGRATPQRLKAPTGGTFQVVKTAQSRGRTERTLLIGTLMFCEWAADARVKSRYKAKQGCCGKTALVWILDPTLVRFLDLVQDKSSNFGNHGGAVTSLSRRDVLRREGKLAEAETVTRETLAIER